MDLTKLKLFTMANEQQRYLDQRQKVIARNIANADTPHFRPSDLKPLDFERLVRDRAMHVSLEKTTERHLGGTAARFGGDFRAKKDRETYEVSPDGNAVVLEEQLIKVGEVQNQHSLNVRLYNKYIDMMKIAVTGRRR